MAASSSMSALPGDLSSFGWRSAAYPNRIDSPCFPDPPPTTPGAVFVDDVTGLNATQVSSVCMVRSVEDVQRVLAVARRRKLKVSIRGTKHSMGGQSMTSGGVVIDTCKLNAIHFDRDSETVTCGTGALWSELIFELNRFGYSPRTMQSYCTFSVGGTLAVNAHGITTDYTLSECVVSFRVVLADGALVDCRRDSADETARELFRLCLGGFGLFGVVVDVTMRVEKNYLLRTTILSLTAKEFAELYPSFLSDPGRSIDLKLCRLDITNPDRIMAFLFRRDSDEKTVSPLPLRPREMGKVSSLLYKWIAPYGQELRFEVEKMLGRAWDWSGAADRNTLMYESAVPLAKLYSPLIPTDDTFVLQEYFVPHSRFLSWLRDATPIYEECRTGQLGLLSLLNTTIRYVHHDTDSWLPYAKASEGMFCFVLYYRVKRTPAGDAALAVMHQKFVRVTLAAGGTFYLPYRHHYSGDELRAAYPGVDDFFRRKFKYDPSGLFSNSWFEHYCPFHVDTDTDTDPEEPVVQPASFDHLQVALRRSDSYQRLLSSTLLRKQFVEGFLVHVFNLENPEHLLNLISRAAWDPRSNRDDVDIFQGLAALLAEHGAGVLGKTLKSVLQLAEQKREITRETLSIVGRLGRFGSLHDYVSIGDHGKLVRSLRKALRLDGTVYVVNDETDHYTVPAVLERGSLDPVGKHVYIDFKSVGAMAELPSACADLVTMNQGLHHLPLDQLHPFLAFVARVLRPGGLFIVREHNAVPELLPMLDLAHSVFNAVTGVPLLGERTEVRAFRPVADWRRLVESTGLFVDTLLYELQPEDVTVDEMMCFLRVEPAGRDLPWIVARPIVPEPHVEEQEPTPVAVVGEERTPTLQQTIVHEVLAIIKSLGARAPELATFLGNAIRLFVAGGISEILSAMVKRNVEAFQLLTDRLAHILTDVERSLADQPPDKHSSTLADFIPLEFRLIPKALAKRVELGRASPAEIIQCGLLTDLMQMISGSKPASSKPRSSSMSSPASSSSSSSSSSSLRAAQSQSSMSSLVVKQSAAAALTRLVDALPQLLDADYVIGSLQLGGALEAQARRALPSDEMSHDEKIAELAAPLNELDARRFRMIDELLAELAAEPLPLPPLAAMLAPSAAHEERWGRLLKVIMSTRPPAGAVLGWLRLIGWGSLARYWQEAVRWHAQLPVEHVNANIVRLSSAHQRVVDVELGEKSLVDVHNVAHVVEAVYSTNTVFAANTSANVTDAVRRCLEPGGRLRLSELRLSDEPNLPDGLRSKSKTLLRGRVLKLRYVQRLTDAGALFNDMAALRQEIQALGLNLPRNARTTYYKLPEWFQVELVQNFGASMVHTPWYRYPFMQFARLYGRLLWKEFAVVYQEGGLSEALFNGSFLTVAVPAVVMGALLLQMSALALPLRLTLGDAYDPAEMVEKVVLVGCDLPQSLDGWRRVLGANLRDCQQLTPTCAVLTVPTFTALTTALIDIAQQLPPTTIAAYVSDQMRIQVKVRCESEPEQLAQMPGVKQLFTYELPVPPGTLPPPNFLFVAYQVDVPSLLAFVRSCLHGKVQIVQIYDFYD